MCAHSFSKSQEPPPSGTLIFLLSLALQERCEPRRSSVGPFSISTSMSGRKRVTQCAFARADSSEPL